MAGAQLSLSRVGVNCVVRVSAAVSSSRGDESLSLPLTETQTSQTTLCHHHNQPPATVEARGIHYTHARARLHASMHGAVRV